MSTKLIQPISRSLRSITSSGRGLPPRRVIPHSTHHHPTRFQTLHNSAPLSKFPAPSSSPFPPPKQPPKPPSNPSLPSFNLLHEVRTARPAVRYTIYAGLGLMATVESTFWFNVIKAKCFPSSSPGDKEEAEEFLANLRGALEGYKAAWMTNYGRYYGGYVWGVGER
ncbi:hypothetical protein CC86DRAFT_116650 [Ophiobolus disseminans]|uniref:Uncharacterized protein n=1 Tax=Ophiobolus disseminans TaxID=1469910 RepID=A0A6A6ZJ26_9PLEO|nr:hypothetical protein CC86DRAFT_116650 [Ophiobolus disseminans]